MSRGWKSCKVGIVVLGAVGLCPGIAIPASAASTQNHRKVKKPAPPLPPLPSGPTGPVQQIPLDSMAAVPPQVSFQNEQLTIVATNSTLADILRAVRKQTGAEIEIPAAQERVVTHLGPGPAREVLAELLNGSRFNYVLLGSPANDALLTRVVLVARTGSEGAGPASGAAMAEQKPPNSAQQEAAPDPTAVAAATDDNTDPAADEAAAEAEEQTPPPDQPGVKTPQEMLQEMQQRQLQLQQQQPPGQPPIPGASFPGGRPPQAPPDQQ